MLCYGPFINNTLLNLFHYFMPVYYGAYPLYTPVVGAPREYLETRCTISINSNVLIRVPFQATTSLSLIHI